MTSDPPAWKISNHFATAIGKRLRDQDIDQYIDSSVVGADRVLARKLMRMMPSNRRGDFVLYDGSRIISNNRALVAQTKLIERPQTQIIATPRGTGRVAASSMRQTRANGSCAPPYHPGTGPYIRTVGACGFTGAWSIVNLACNTTMMYDPREAGYMYVELRDASGGLEEAGMFTKTGLAGQNDINPYLSASTHL
ncbi:MAG TPA: hypothetical protein VK665_04890, partial [Candidatus Elarobacter sp.]|nr:hypothetical protein [Candidatus Elarobacter sp.]